MQTPAGRERGPALAYGLFRKSLHIYAMAPNRQAASFPLDGFFFGLLESTKIFTCDSF
jgi:hypothetical protein